MLSKIERQHPPASHSKEGLSLVADPSWLHVHRWLVTGPCPPFTLWHHRFVPCFTSHIYIPATEDIARWKGLDWKSKEYQTLERGWCQYLWRVLELEKIITDILDRAKIVGVLIDIVVCMVPQLSPVRDTFCSQKHRRMDYWYVEICAFWASAYLILAANSVSLD